MIATTEKFFNQSAHSWCSFFTYRFVFQMIHEKRLVKILPAIWETIQTNLITNSLSFFLLFRGNQKTSITFLGLSVNIGMRNRGTEWGEWWECLESGWECRESGWFFVRMFMFIASAKIPEREKSISTLSFYGQLLDYNSHVFCIVYQVDEFYFK